MKLKVIKFPGYIKPNRAHYNDSGADCFATKETIIAPGKCAKIPTGVGVELPDGYDIIVHCKSGLSSRGLLLANAPVDAGYKGEIHAIVYNSTNERVIIKRGEKIGQFVVRPVIYAEFVEELGDERLDGAFGSTGK